MSKAGPSVGDQIDARCTKCRKILNHTIVAMVDSRPVRVMCNTCQGQHNYKDPNAPKKTKTSTTKTPRVTKAKANHREIERQEWENLCSAKNSVEAASYAMDGQYVPGSLIKHKVFGLGVVEQATGNRKMIVIFEEGKKVLRCA